MHVCHDDMVAEGSKKMYFYKNKQKKELYSGMCKVYIIIIRAQLCYWEPVFS